MNLSGFRNHFNRNWNKYLLGVFIICALILRFYNFPYRYGLGDETVRDAAVAIVGARELQAPLTGPFSSAGPFTFGPWYYYQLILAQTVLPSYYASWIYLSIASALCIILLYKIGSFFGRGFGILLAFLGTISPSLILAGTHLTNPNLSNLFAFFSIYLFLRLMHKNSSNWWGLAFGVSLGIAVNIHYQMMGLFILPLLFIFFKPKRYVNFLCVLLGIFVVFIPLLFFDLINHWFNLKNIFYYYTEGKNLIYIPNRWLFYLRDFWPSYLEEVTGLPRWAVIPGVLISSGIVAFNIYKKKVPLSIILLLMAFAVNFILLRYYWGERFFGYLNYIRPLVVFFEGYTIYLLYKMIKWKRLQIAFLGIIVFLLLLENVPKIIPLLERDTFTMYVQEVQGELIKQYPEKKFLLLICPGPGNTRYSSISHSLLFLLDSEKMLSENGTPIGFIDHDCLPNGARIASMPDNANKDFNKISGTDLIDFSNHSTASISAMGWQKHSLKLIHDTTVRWWFDEQP